MNNSLCCATFTMYQLHLRIIISGVNINNVWFRCWNDAFRWNSLCGSSSTPVHSSGIQL